MIKNSSIFLIVIFTLILGISLSANAEKTRCFVDICIDPSSIKISKSDFPGAPSYSVRTILGTQQKGDRKMLAQMEINCRQREFRTVRISEDGANWSNFDPRWTLTAEKSSLSKLVDYTCKLPIAKP